VYGDFYSTMAQVLLLLLLALIWNSSYLDRVRGQRRPKRSEDSAGVRFWTKPRVRVYILFVTAVVIVSSAITMLVLGGMFPDSFALRVVLMCALAVPLGTLLYRVWYDVIAATAIQPDEPASDAIDRNDQRRGTITTEGTA
jgi:hypothetical protein